MFNFFQLVLQTVKIQYHLQIIEITVFAICDVLAQFILVRTMAMVMIIIHLILQKIYRCWIVWGYSIRVVIIPSLLAFIFLGPLIYFHSPINFNLWFLLAFWIMGRTAPLIIVQSQLYVVDWNSTLAIAGLALSKIGRAHV